jgi:hypothetical protein
VDDRANPVAPIRAVILLDDILNKEVIELAGERYRRSGKGFA